MNLFRLVRWVIIGILILILFRAMAGLDAPASEFSPADLEREAKAGHVTHVVVNSGPNTAVIRSFSDKVWRETTMLKSEAETLVKILRQHVASVKVEESSEDQSWYVSPFVGLLPLLIIVGAWWYFMKTQMQGGPGAKSFWPKAINIVAQKPKTRFKDVAGIDEAKAELEEIIEFLRNPEKFSRLGGKMPKGVLLTGPPGCGKTLLARAVAGEADVPFLIIAGSDFVEMFVGVGAKRVRETFACAEKLAPCILFIDELDAVGRHRGAGLGGGHDEREQTLNEILVKMDGFKENSGVIVMAATNRPDILDPALTRPGRFDRQVHVPLPDINGRLAILKIHSQQKTLDPDVDLSRIARSTPGFSGADLENLCNEAAISAARRERAAISAKDFENERDKIIAGAERKIAISDGEKEIIAFHESGHVIVTVNLPETDPVHRVSIIARGRSLGSTLYLPEKDQYLFKKERVIATITSLLGGRAAEEVALGIQTSGAKNDIERATELAHEMVTSWGMSEKIGLINVESSDRPVFLGLDVVMRRRPSEAIGAMIDEETRSIINKCHEDAKKILRDNRAKLDKLARTLIEKETLEAEEINAILAD